MLLWRLGRRIYDEQIMKLAIRKIGYFLPYGIVCLRFVSYPRCDLFSFSQPDGICLCIPGNLFPAWVVLAYLPERMGWVRSIVGYVIGLATWRWLLGHRYDPSFLGFCLSGFVLMGAGLDFLQIGVCFGLVLYSSSVRHCRS